MYRFRGFGLVEIDDPIQGYAKLLSSGGIGGEFTQRALIEATNIYNRRNVGNTLASDRAALASGGIPALVAALANLGTVSSTNVDTWDQAQAGGSGNTVNLSTLQAQAAAAVAPTPVVPQPAVVPAQGAPVLTTTLPAPAAAPAAGFDFSAIPMWLWLGAGAVAVYSFSSSSGGSKRR